MFLYSIGTHAYTYTCAHTCVHTCTQTYTCAHTHTHTYTFVHTVKRTHILFFHFYSTLLSFLSHTSFFSCCCLVTHSFRSFSLFSSSAPLLSCPLLLFSLLLSFFIEFPLILPLLPLLLLPFSPLIFFPFLPLPQYPQPSHIQSPIC